VRHRLGKPAQPQRRRPRRGEFERQRVTVERAAKPDHVADLFVADLKRESAARARRTVPPRQGHRRAGRRACGTASGRVARSAASFSGA
jgi:hypothetical protein